MAVDQLFEEIGRAADRCSCGDRVKLVMLIMCFVSVFIARKAAEKRDRKVCLFRT